MKHNLDQSKKQQIKSNLSRHLDTNHPDIIFAYIFGSFIQKGAFSDIDLAVGLRLAPSDSLDYELTLETELANVAGYPVDVRIINSAPNTFAYQVLRNGELIRDIEPNFRANFCSRVLKTYFDFEPFRKRYLRDIANRAVAAAKREIISVPVTGSEKGDKPHN